MTSSNFQINSYNSNTDPNNESDSDSTKTKKKIPERDFREIADQVDPKKYKGQLQTKKKTTKKAKSSFIKPKSALADADDDEKKVPSIFDLAGGKKPLDSSSDQEDDASKEEEIAMLSSPYQQLSRNANIKNSQESFQLKNDLHFLPEQPDLSTIAPLWMEHQIDSSNLLKSAEGEITTVQKSMQELIDQIAKQVSIMESQGQTDTVVKLNSELFRDVNLTLTEFSSATGQVNISFDNLTQEAERLLQMSKAALINVLQKHDIVVQRFETATIDLTPRIETGRDFEKREQQGRGDGQQKDNKQR